MPEWEHPMIVNLMKALIHGAHSKLPAFPREWKDQDGEFWVLKIDRMNPCRRGGRGRRTCAVTTVNEPMGWALTVSTAE
jgi:hypothetical protein